MLPKCLIPKSPHEAKGLGLGLGLPCLSERCQSLPVPNFDTSPHILLFKQEADTKACGVVIRMEVATMMRNHEDVLTKGEDGPMMSTLLLLRLVTITVMTAKMMVLGLILIIIMVMILAVVT